MSEERNLGLGDYDWALALSAAAVALITGIMVTGAYRRDTALETSTPIGTLAFLISDGRRRPAGSLVWYDLQAGDRVYALDSIFVPARSAASFLLADGSRLEVDENTLVVLDRTRDSQSVDLKKGSVLGSAGAVGLLIRSADALTRLGGNSQARVDADDAHTSLVAVLAGVATVHSGQVTHTLQRDHIALSGAGGLAPSTARRVRLLEPERNERIFFSGEVPTLALRWEDASGLEVQIAADRMFTRLVASAPAGEGRYELALPGPGLYWWRLVDPAGEERSEARRLSLIEDLPPQIVYPRPGERVQEGAVALAWSAAGGARFELQIARDPRFERLAHVKQVAGTQVLWSTAGEDEGVLHWRIRALADGRSDAPFSEPSEFTLVRRPPPDAPVLIDPQIEVEPAPGPR